jgi:dethiobiotin synthetase
MPKRLSGADSSLVFVTGTDTGVGKTTLTCLLLCYLIHFGTRVAAVTPLGSGGRGDARLLARLQNWERPLELVNPFWFAAPLAPGVAARLEGRPIRFVQVLRHLDRMQASCDCLLVEGAGGLLTPLGEGFTLADLVVEMNGTALVVAANRLGAINHTLLTVSYLRHLGIKKIKMVLMERGDKNLACHSNSLILRELLANTPVFSVPFLGSRAAELAVLKKNAKINQKTLAGILRIDRLYASVAARQPAAEKLKENKKKF